MFKRVCSAMAAAVFTSPNCSVDWLRVFAVSKTLEHCQILAALALSEHNLRHNSTGLFAKQSSVKRGKVAAKLSFIYSTKIAREQARLNTSYQRAVDEIDEIVREFISWLLMRSWYLMNSLKFWFPAEDELFCGPVSYRTNWTVGKLGRRTS